MIDPFDLIGGRVKTFGTRGNELGYGHWLKRAADIALGQSRDTST
jgi:hypothetical protein